MTMVTTAGYGEMQECDCAQLPNGEWLPVWRTCEVDGVTHNRSFCVQDYTGDYILREGAVQLYYGGWATADDTDIVTLRDGRLLHSDNVAEIGGDYYDSREVRCCHSCEDNILLAECYVAPDDHYLCEDCFDDLVGRCDSCGRERFNDDLAYDEDDDCSYCNRCSGGGSLIRSYSDRSANKKKPEHQGKDLYGVELEVEHKTDAEDGAKYVNGFLDKGYVTLKTDGSLGHTGFEIVTRPDGIDVHKRKFKALFDDRPGRFLSSWSNGRCGMHVHVNKAALSQLQLGKMLCFLNEPTNGEMLAKIAGRRAGRWCRAYKKKISDINHPNDRYVALNITSKTAEVRIFRGTLSQAGFFKNLEFVQALVEFCSPASRGIKEAVSAADFCKWLPRKQYPALHKFLVERGYIIWNQKRKAG